MKKLLLKAIFGVIGMFIAFLAAMIVMLYIMGLGAEQASKEIRKIADKQFEKISHGVENDVANKPVGDDNYEDLAKRKVKAAQDPVSLALTRALETGSERVVFSQNGLRISWVEKFVGDMAAGEISDLNETFPICQNANYSRCYKVYLNKFISIYPEAFKGQVCTESLKRSLQNLEVDFISFEIDGSNVKLGQCRSSNALKNVMEKYKRYLGERSKI